MAPRILYLHALRGKPVDQRARALIESFGAGSVLVPDLKTRRYVAAGILLYALLGLISIAVLVLAFLRLPGWAGAVATLILSVGGFSIQMLLFRGLTALCVSHAVRVATAAYDNIQPNLIVCQGFGAVIARRIQRPKPALLLFEPTLEKYATWSGDHSHRRLDSYPFVMVVDEASASADSIRTVERAEPERARHEVIEASQATDELHRLVEECYEAGKQGAEQLAKLDPHAAIPVDAF